jgi:hypothetical protein
MIRFEEELNQAGVDPDELSPPGSTLKVFASIVRRSIVFLLMLGPAVIGTIAHYPAYKLGGFLATRISRDSDDVISTVKIISAMLLFPLTWIVLAVLSYLYFGWIAAVLCGDRLLRRARQVDRRGACIDVFPGKKTVFCQITGRAKCDTK